MKSDAHERRAAATVPGTGPGARSLLVLAALLLVLIACLTRASARPGGGPHPPLGWRALPPHARHVLRPFAPRWRHLPLRRRARLYRAARHWLALPAWRRRQIMARLRNWRRLPPRIRQRLWRRYRAFQRLPAAERRRILRAYRRFRRLPAWKQRALLRRWKRAHHGPGLGYYLPSFYEFRGSLASTLRRPPRATIRPATILTP